MTEAPSVGNCPACGLSNPSAEAVRRLRAKLRDTVRCCYGANAATLVKALASIVRGWAAYLRSQVSSKLFSQLDTYLWTPTCGSHLQMGDALPPEQAETLGGRPVLRQVRHVQ